MSISLSLSLSLWQLFTYIQHIVSKLSEYMSTQSFKTVSISKDTFIRTIKWPIESHFRKMVYNAPAAPFWLSNLKSRLCLNLKLALNWSILYFVQNWFVPRMIYPLERKIPWFLCIYSLYFFSLLLFYILGKNLSPNEANHILVSLITSWNILSIFGSLINLLLLVAITKPDTG